jgi:hypothetical protein
VTTIEAIQHDATNRPEVESAGGEGAVGAPRDQRRTRLWLALLLLAGLVFYLPALRSPYLLDDYLHASMIDGTFPAKRGPLDLYNFVDDADRTTLLHKGVLPWWSHPKLTIRFFRPLSSALLWADHKLLGNGPVPLHVHSFAWWVAVVLAARAFFRRLFSPRVAWIATVIFALAPCHVLPLAWLANREAFISLTFGTLALSAYVRWRAERRLRDGAVATLLFALSLVGGEYAVCLGGYVLAFELFRRGDGPGRRALGLLPFAAPAAAYLAARARLGYGAAGSGFYTDPFHETRAFLGVAPRRFGTLLADLWLTLDNQTLNSDTPAWALALLVVGVAALLIVPLRRTLAGLDDERRATARWLLLGSFLALTPVLAVVPSPRLLGASLLGVAPVVALLLEQAWFTDVRAERRGAAELTGLAALSLGFAHLVHGPATSWLVGRHFAGTAVLFVKNAAELRARIADPAHAEVMVIRGLGGSFFLPFALDQHGAPPARWRILAQTGHALALRRGARVLDILVPEGQGVFPTGSGNLFRNERVKVSAGNTYVVPGLRATILEMGAQGPRAVRYEFDRDLEDPSYTWISEGLDGYKDTPPPQIGFGEPLDP